MNRNSFFPKLKFYNRSVYRIQYKSVLLQMGLLIEFSFIFFNSIIEYTFYLNFRSHFARRNLKNIWQHNKNPQTVLSHPSWRYYTIYIIALLYQLFNLN